MRLRTGSKPRWNAALTAAAAVIRASADSRPAAIRGTLGKRPWSVVASPVNMLASRAGRRRGCPATVPR
jgi:hypothetical protein